MASPERLSGTTSPHWLDPRGGCGRVLIGDDIGGVVMRAGRGAEVSFHLSLNGFAGPILTRRAKPFSWWTFLTTGGYHARDRAALADLLTAQVTVLAPGTVIVLPPFRDASGEVNWVTTPSEETRLLPWQAVLAALRATTGSGW